MTDTNDIGLDDTDNVDVYADEMDDTHNTTIRSNELIVAHGVIRDNIIHAGSTFRGNDDTDKVIAIEDASAITTTSKNTMQVRETFQYIPQLPLLKKLLANSKI